MPQLFFSCGIFYYLYNVNNQLNNEKMLDKKKPLPLDALEIWMRTTEICKALKSFEWEEYFGLKGNYILNHPKLQIIYNTKNNPNDFPEGFAVYSEEGDLILDNTMDSWELAKALSNNSNFYSVNTQQAALYLGRPCKVGYGKALRISTVTVDTLADLANDEDWVCEIELRQLASMTKEECDELCTVMLSTPITCYSFDIAKESDFLVANFRNEETTGCEYSNIVMGIQIDRNFNVNHVWNYKYPNGTVQSSEQLYNHHFVTLWFINKGFDVFGWTRKIN
jgi:hypothetical protein